MGMDVDGMARRLEKVLVPIFFGLYLLVGVLIHTDYGVSWDEPISRTNGLVNLKYVHATLVPGTAIVGMDDVPDLENWADKDYGVAFELPLVAVERALGVGEEDLYPFRHLVIFLFSVLGILAVYGVARFVYEDWRLGVLAALMLMLSPRIFGESFYNSKDIIFMAAIAMAIYTFTRMVTKPGLLLAIFHGWMSAFAIDVRIMGITIVAATIGILVVRAVKKDFPASRVLTCLLAYLVATAIFVVALFPYLWADPAGHFMDALGSMARFRWNGWVLYLGNHYLAAQLPWHYLPVWILVTTPLTFSALMMVGAVHGVRTLSTNRIALWVSEIQMLELSYLALLFVPTIAIIAMRAVVYDGWRHLYFIYPSFVLVAVAGFAALMRRGRTSHFLKIAVSVGLVLTFVSNGYWMVQSHPLQNVYFNALAGRHWKERFDVDYWGMGNRAALEAIIKADGRRVISIKAISATPLDRALLSMPVDDRERFVFSTPESKPEFILTNYRFAKFCEGMCDLTDYALFYQKKIGGEVIVSVFRLRDLSLADTVTRIDRRYSADEFRSLSYRIERRYKRGDQTYIDLRIDNAGPLPISAASAVGTPIRVSWRFLDEEGVATEGWNTRRDLPRDVRAEGSLTMSIPVADSMQVPGGTLQVSLVQEGVFWGHDIGIPDANFPWESSRP